MNDVEAAIWLAARRILPSLTTRQLQARAQRRRRPTLTHPPREWCLALRAGDHRITPMHAPMVPEDATDPLDLDHPGKLLPHDLTITTPLLRHLSSTILLTQGATRQQAAAKLGVTPATLHHRRFKNILRTDWQRGRWGRWYPILSADDFLDPAARNFQPTDPRLWSWTADRLAHRLPEDFSQTITRVPTYRHRTRRYEHHPHPEHPNNDPPEPRLNTSMRLPKPPPDPVWYKWKGDTYIGYDWRNPHAKIGYERYERYKSLRRDRARELRRKGRLANPAPATGSLVFREWRWLCPRCAKPVRMLYYPLPPPTLALLSECPIPLRTRKAARILDQFRSPPEPHSRRGKAPEAPAPRAPPRIEPQSDCSTSHQTPTPTLACKHCHRIRYLSQNTPHWWNDLIAYLTGGLLYGREVPKPPWLLQTPPTRKKKYTPLLKPAPLREKVRTRLLNGWTTQQIAQDLQMSTDSVHQHMKKIFHQESVKNRHALAAKLNSPHPQPKSPEELARERRATILAMLLQGKTYKQIMAHLNIDYGTVNYDVSAIYKEHGVTRHRPGTNGARAALLKKLTQHPPKNPNPHQPKAHGTRSVGSP